MKTIGLLGGMSWESSIEYYRIINEETKKILGGTHSAKCLMYSFDFHEIEALQHKGNWGLLKGQMIEQAKNLKKGGADFVVICTNTMHIMAAEIESEAGLKVLHIADVTGAEIRKRGLRKVALLGTEFTMKKQFYKGLLKDQYNLDVIIPEGDDGRAVHEIIYCELVSGIISDSSRKEYVEIIDRMVLRGAEGVILGCTEIPLLIKQRDVSIPVFDTTKIHAMAAVRYAMENILC